MRMGDSGEFASCIRLLGVEFTREDIRLLARPYALFFFLFFFPWFPPCLMRGPNAAAGLDDVKIDVGERADSDRFNGARCLVFNLELVL